MVTSVRWVRFFQEVQSIPSRLWEQEPMAPSFLPRSGTDCGHCCIYFFQFCEAHLDLCFAKLSAYPVAGRRIVWIIFGWTTIPFQLTYPINLGLVYSGSGSMPHRVRRTLPDLQAVDVLKK